MDVTLGKSATIKRVYNNNVLLAMEADSTEVVLLGKGSVSSADRVKPWTLPWPINVSWLRGSTGPLSWRDCSATHPLTTSRWPRRSPSWVMPLWAWSRDSR